MPEEKIKSPCAKDIEILPISAASAARIIRKYHYSGTVVNNSKLHFGVFLNGRCEGAMQFGPSFDKTKMQNLVHKTRWNGFIELNRLAFSERLPRNSESRAIAIALRIIKKTYPHIEWVVSFADATQCGDGTIYRAAGFSLVGIRENQNTIMLKDGTTATAMTYTKGRHILQDGGSKLPEGAVRMKGHQLKYIYFLNPSARRRLSVPALPFSDIAKHGAGMYKGSARVKHNGNAAGVPLADGGSIPTLSLQNSERFESCLS